jgi:hypothetical protein
VKRVLVAPNAPEAHVAAAALESAGIEAAIHGEHMGAFPAGPVSRPSVWVRDEDYAAACEVLGVAQDASQTSPAAGRPPAMWILLAIVAVILALLWIQR